MARARPEDPQWKPSITLATVLSAIQEKVNNPSADDPFEPEIAAQLKNDKAAFLSTAREWTKNKWSDVKQHPVPDSARSSPPSDHPSAPLPALPPVGDFRTSLILPDLSRRFTVLRAPSGDPVSLEDLRVRLADQRARGAKNHLSEEEEDMFLQTLGRIRSKPSVSSTSGDSIQSTARESFRSSETATSSIPSTSSAAKRFSNNMFGSGKFRDYTYLRSVAKDRAGAGKASASRRSTNSSSLSTIGRSYKASDTSIPEDSQTDLELSAHDSETTIAPRGKASSFELEEGIVKSFQPGHLRRASMALEEVIREIEEEVEVEVGRGGADGDSDGDGDDKILIPRSPAPERASSLTGRSVDKPRPVPSIKLSDSVYETGTAVSSDPSMQADAPEFRPSPSPYPRAETSPTPRLPGYIPGMPRPMTPRETTFDHDEVSPSSSSTPRATSPRIPGSDRPTSPNVSTSSALRRDSTSMRQSHRASPPIMTNPGAPIASLLSGVNGRFTPDHSHTLNGPSVEFSNPLDSSLLGRRRPVSPFSQGAYQSMTVSSRPSTPSNVTWKAPTAPGNGSGVQSRSGSAVGSSESDLAITRLPSPVRNGLDRSPTHTRSDSNISSNDLHDFAQLNLFGSPLGSRSLRSPPLPDSPVFENSVQSGIFTLHKRGHPSAPVTDTGSSPLESSALRSSTPTQYPPRSSASPVYPDPDHARSSQRGSRQATASPFALNQSQALILSPIANSSRSSLESAGSSYHTWEADKQGPVLPLVAALVPQPPAWHDLSDSTGDLSSAADGDAEEVVQQYSGLNKRDFAAIQGRLLFAAKLKAEVPEPRERRNSLRKRRPSTSQSAMTTGLNEIQAADVVQQGSTQRPMSQDSALKASALLDSVVDSIQAPRLKLGELKTDTDLANSNSSAEPEPSSATRRKNALARALFGPSDSDQSLTSPSPPPMDDHDTSSSVLPAERPLLIEISTSSRSLRETLSPSSPSVNDGVGTSSSSVTEALDKRQNLAREVQRRAEAAMADLNRMPSNAKVSDFSQRKRIEVGQISAPKLVSASTSVDTIPSIPRIRPGLELRLKRFRGSLRAKPTPPASDEPTQPSLDQSSAHTDRSLATPDGPLPPSTTDHSRSKVVSLPATAVSPGPGLKGFVSRFLKPRSGDISEPDRRKQLPSSSNSLATPSVSQHVQSAPPRDKSFRPHTPVSPDSAPPFNPPPSAPIVTAPVPDGSTARAVDQNALKQFMDAANNLGLDKDALTDFLARSPSVGSRLTGHSSKRSTALSGDGSGRGRRDSPLTEPTLLSAPSPGSRRNLGPPPQRQSGEVIAKAPTRRPLGRNVVTPDSTNSTIVRRTLIFPSEAKQSNLDPGTGLRKSSSTRRRRSTSAASVQSNRSLHDRVPTPPPPKPLGRRFSAEQSPPMPHIPSSLLAQTEAINAPQSAPVVPLEKYDMYTGDGRPAISVTPDVQHPDASGSNLNTLHNMEPGTAVEVLELANGETIWSIVNGLRDDDEESFGNRASLCVRVFFKEHGRTGSKDSQSSFQSRKKVPQVQKRPETKVFFSSSAQIGRLIDNLSHETEAGSFNILPTNLSPALVQPDSSHWTVEERLEHMLNTLATP
ncbi:hypothetical protein F5148DRAFT_1146881 [Russula earlei]|uniref:Uncharacterized protein n=1 Tax=Russula earlei TaxID=71964 RepID=A0ACC0UI27_9AGAM|nr:hypothetical protein F5148DRAFT_1146881 [Russula earlei]